MTNREKQLQAKLEAVLFSLSLSGLTRQSRDFSQLHTEGFIFPDLYLVIPFR
jgi:hypothetical protein